MAVSHVWSDGTGVGLSQPGNVNSCLLHHFETIAKTLRCQGIWWDTISIPTDKDKRTLALNVMHQNYSAAACTLVHDLELVNFTWQEDGSPCLALVMSTWFSRGWTALELRASRSVKVLFRDSAGDPVLKDLDSEILADDDIPFFHPAYKAASLVIRKLRLPKHRVDFDVPLFQNLVRALRPRYTCWGRDKIIIAGLLAAELFQDVSWFDSSLSELDITKAIIKRYGRVNYGLVFHNRIPVSESGPWSWCPPSIFDLNDIQTPERRLEVRGEQLIGQWHWIVLRKEDASNLTPFSSHEYLTSRIEEALERPDGHLLLFPPFRTLKLVDEPFALVRKVSQPRLSVMECRFIGTVIGRVFRASDEIHRTLDLVFV